MGEKTDLRIIKTKAAIRKAFLDLLKEKPFDQIMINDITKAAMINRSTFYLHYQDKYDLMEKLENEMISSMEEFSSLLTPQSIQACQKERKPLPHIIPLMQYIRKNAIMFQLISKRGNGDPFFRKVSTIFFHKVQECLNLDLKDELQDYRTDACISIACAVLNRWVSEKNSINEELLASYLTRIIWSALLID